MPRVSRMVAASADAGRRAQQIDPRRPPPLRRPSLASRPSMMSQRSIMLDDQEIPIETVEVMIRLIRRVRLRFALFRFVDEFLILRRMMERLRRIVVYLVFMAFFTISTVYAFQEQDLYHMASNLKGQITETEFEPADSGVKKTFEDVETIAEVHQWLRGPLARTLYTGSTLWVENYASYPNPRPGSVYGYNMLLGGVRISQLRMLRQQADSCPAKLARLFSSQRNMSELENYANQSDAIEVSKFQLPVPVQPLCVGVQGDYDQSVEERAPVGEYTWGGLIGNESKLYHQVVDERNPFGIGASDGGGIRGPTGASYPAPAYPVVLPNRNYSEALALLHELADAEYFDLQTKLFRVDFAVYNPHLDKFHSVAVVFETNRGGGLEKGYYHSTATLHSPFESKDWLTVGSELLVAGFFCWFIVEEVFLIRTYGFSHLAKTETVMHLINITSYLVVWIFRFMAIGTSPDLDKVDVSMSTYYGYVIPVRWKHAAVQVNALNAVLAWMKIAKAMTIIPQFQTVLGTLSRSFIAAVPFVIVFMVFVYAFASSYLLVFGSQLGDYRNIGYASWSLFKTILGEFELDGLASASYFLGPLLAVSFVALALFVILNMLVAIVLDSYQEEVNDLLRHPPHPVLPFLSAYTNLGLYQVFGMECRRWYRDQEQTCGGLCGLRCSRRHQVIVELMCTDSGAIPDLPSLDRDEIGVVASAPKHEGSGSSSLPQSGIPRTGSTGMSDALAQLIGKLPEAERVALFGRFQDGGPSKGGTRHDRRSADGLVPVPSSGGARSSLVGPEGPPGQVPLAASRRRTGSDDTGGSPGAVVVSVSRPEPAHRTSSFE